MKKIILKVRQKGIMFNLNGQKFRTPVEIDITQMKIDPIISQMRIYGISDYEISTVENITDIVKDKLSKTKVIIVDSKNDEQIDKLNNRIENLECMLHELLNKNNSDEKEWEQNNKSSDTDDVSIDINKKHSNKPKIVKGEKPKIVKEKPKEVIKNKPKIVSKESKDIINDKLSKKIIIEELEEIDDINIINDKLSKKIIIEELEEIDDINIILEKKKETFNVKNFKYEEINEPFKLSPDIEKLKKYKK